MKESTRIVTALVAAVGGGMLIAATGSEALIRGADALVPIGTLWINAIRMTVIPLVVALIVTGVASANDMKTIGSLGGRTLVVFLVLLIGMAAVVMPIASSVFAAFPDGVRPPLPPGAAEAAAQLASDPRQTFAGWLTSLIPTNPIAAAADGSMVSLVIFTILAALAITRTAPSTRATLVELFRAVSETMLVLVRWVVLLAPIGIFAMLLPLAAHAGTSLAGAIGLYIAAYSGLTLAMILLVYPVAAFWGKRSMREFARAAFPAQLIAFTSSSSVASLPALVESAEQGLRLPQRVTGFVLPIAVSMFKLAAPVSWTVGALFIGWFYNIPVGIQSLGIVAFTAVFLSFAGPGVPRGAFIILTPMFVQIGLPPEGIGILIAIDAIPDTFATVLNVTGDLAAATIVAGGEREG
jgi:Na+/H+-dicarboxylate symporter